MRTARLPFVRHCAVGLALMLGLLIPSTLAEATQASKPRLAITKITATPSVMRQEASSQGTSVLEQVLEGTDGQLMNAMQQTRKFELVGRSDLAAILKEQDLAASGLVNPADPQTARQFELAGVKYVATVSISNFEDITERATLEGQFGATKAERRSIQLQAVVRIYDTTSGTMLDSTNVRLDKSMINEILPGATEQGRKTNILIGDVTTMLAREAANSITDSILPPKVLAYTMGVITFNRTAGSGVESGQAWEVFAPGEELIDPDTGESLGSEEISIGWARVTDAGSKFSKARAVEDFGIERGSIMRHRPDGLPAHVDPDGRATGSARGGRGGAGGAGGAGSGGRGGAGGAGSGDAGSPGGSGRGGRGGAGSPGGSGRGGRGGAGGAGGGGRGGAGGAGGDGGHGGDGAAAAPLRKMAIFVRNNAPNVSDDVVSMLEDQVTSQLSNTGVELISRSIVLNAVSNMANQGANRGTGDPMNTVAQRLLSDEASASSLASTLGADGLVVVSIASYNTDTRDFNDTDLGIHRVTTFYTLDVAWSLLGSDGGTLASNMASARTGIQQSETLQRDYDPLNQLMMDDARQIGDGVAGAMHSQRLARDTGEADTVQVDISIVLADLSIPEIVEDANGNWVVTANQYKLSPMNATVMVDGFIVGSAPGPIPMSAGQHRITIERPMLETIDRFVVARQDMSLVIPMQLSKEGRRQWMETAAFIEGLKNGAVLRKVELEKAQGLAEFLRNSRINLDTSNVKNLSVGSRMLWGQLIDD